MPKVKAGESRKDYMSRCIPIVMKEGSGMTKEQAAGKCGGMYDSAKRDLTLGEQSNMVSTAWADQYASENYELYSWVRWVFADYCIVSVKAWYIKVPYTISDGVVTFADAKKWKRVEHSFRDLIQSRIVTEPIRAVENEDGTKQYRCYGVLFGTEEEKDLYGTFFTRDTDYCLDWYDTRPWLYGHGMNPFIGARKIGDWKVGGMDDKGIFLLGELDAREKYLSEIQTLIDAEKLYPSQGAASYLVGVEDDGWVSRWPLIEVSSTVAPANFRQEPFRPEVAKAVRALEGVDAMGKLQDALNSVLGREAQPPDGAEDTSGVADATREAPPEGEGEGAEMDSLTDALREVSTELENVRTVIDGYGENEELIVQAIQMIDGTVRSLSERLDTMQETVNGLAQDEAQRLQNAMQGDDWTRSLFSATRDIPAPEGEGEEDGVGGEGGTPPPPTGLAEGETLWERMSKPPVPAGQQ